MLDLLARLHSFCSQHHTELFPDLGAAGTEDQFVYADANGYYHAVFHHMYGTGTKTQWWLVRIAYPFLPPPHPPTTRKPCYQMISQFLALSARVPSRSPCSSLYFVRMIGTLMICHA